MNAIVTLVCGSSYKENFTRYCYPNWKAYAHRHGLELIIYDDILDRTTRAQSRSIAWQKCLAVCDERVLKFKQIVWLDSDIAINSQRAPNIFDSISVDEVGAVPDFTYPDPARYRGRLEYCYNHWRSLGIPYIENMTPQEFMIRWGLPPTEAVVQTGVLVVNPEAHGGIFKKTYDNYEDRGSAAWNYEMRPLSYELLEGCVVKWLDFNFNVVPIFAVNDQELATYLTSPVLMERAFRKLMGEKSPLHITKQKRMRRIYERLFDDGFFLHFAGCQEHMSHLKNRIGASAD